MTPEQPPTRTRIVDAAMRLFGEKGYAGTSVADIEAASGLSPGSGSLYRHFPTKQAVLTEGVRQRVSGAAALLHQLATETEALTGDLRAEAGALVEAGLRRLEQEADLNRLVVKDLNQFPELMELAATADIAAVHAAVAGWLSARSGRDGDPTRSLALASVLVGATFNFWQLVDIFGAHPAGVDRESFSSALVEVVQALLGSGAAEGP